MLISADKPGNADAFIVRYQPCPKFLLTVQRNALVQYIPAGRFIVRDLFRKHICFLRFRLYRLPYTYSFADNQTIIRGQITFNHDTSLLVGFLYQFFVSCHLFIYHFVNIVLIISVSVRILMRGDQKRFALRFYVEKFVNCCLYALRGRTVCSNYSLFLV